MLELRVLSSHPSLFFNGSSIIAPYRDGWGECCITAPCGGEMVDRACCITAPCRGEITGGAHCITYPYGDEMVGEHVASLLHLIVAAWQSAGPHI